MTTYVVDIDGTLCLSEPGCDYSKCEPINDVINSVNKCYDNGDNIILLTARGMRSYNKDIEQINKYVKPVLVEWLNKHNVKYDQLIMGKPWGEGGVFYVDDKCLTPEQFIEKEN